jgi:hypothetical protein
LFKYQKKLTVVDPPSINFTSRRRNTSYGVCSTKPTEGSRFGGAFDPPIREFENACGSIATGGGSDFNTQIFPYRILTVSVDGSFTTFSPELLGMTSKAYGSLEIGNIRTDSLRGALQSPKYQQLFLAIASGVERSPTSSERFEIWIEQGGLLEPVIDRDCFSQVPASVVEFT